MRTLLALAHSDDETLGATSCLLTYPRSTWLLHCTNSSPRNPYYATRAGFATNGEYERARRRETLKAMELAGVPAEQCFQLDVPDQEAAIHVPMLVDVLVRMAGELRVDRILTHAYEGGHPDHDAIAVAAWLAGQRMPQVTVIEMPFYHAVQGRLRLQEFLPAETPTERVELSRNQLLTKRQMLACYRTQKSIVELFPASSEQFRRQPRYDFLTKPHEGQLYYETKPWGWSWTQWQDSVRPAVREEIGGREMPRHHAAGA